MTTPVMPRVERVRAANASQTLPGNASTRTLLQIPDTGVGTSMSSDFDQRRWNSAASKIIGLRNEVLLITLQVTFGSPANPLGGILGTLLTPTGMLARGTTVDLQLDAGGNTGVVSGRSFDIIGSANPKRESWSVVIPVASTLADDIVANGLSVYSLCPDALTLTAPEVSIVQLR